MVADRPRLVAATVVSAIVAFAAGCSSGDGPDIESAASFERLPLYWLGESFEDWEVSSISGIDGTGALWRTPSVIVTYGTCTPDGGFEPSCTTPLQLQIFPLCWHLEAVARPAGRGHTVRGAPVGTQDGAPVLLTRKTQIKVYRGEGSDPGTPIRALRALRSLNTVPPVVSEADRIPPPPSGILEGKRPCAD